MGSVQPVSRSTERVDQKAMMPTQQPGKSKQDYQTPFEFMQAVKQLLNIEKFEWDLAADELNRQAEKWYGPGGVAEDSLDWELDWPTEGWCWLNPPYSHIKPWVAKACNGL